MNKMNGILSGSIALVWAFAIAIAPTSALAEDVYLRAMPFAKDVRDGAGMTSIPMWGYASCTGTAGVFDTCGAPTSPGPTIEVTEGQDLTIYVDNQLSATLTNVTNETSVLIPALPKLLMPARFPDTGTDPSHDNRIYSFDAVTAQGAVGTYVWTLPTPGTYFYHSGTHPQVQVQMGLYGAVVVRAATNVDCLVGPCAYSDVSYDQEAVVIFSEIDPGIHAAVDADTYGTTSGPTSTEYYQPRYFLINGESFPSPSLDPLLTAGLNGNLLLRMINAGLENRVPQFIGEYFRIIAEDGNRAPADRSQHTLLLPAGKAKDIILQPGTAGSLTLIDRRLRTINNDAATGGMFARIDVAAVPPIANAGPDQTAAFADTVTLDGSGSSDPGGDPLTYSWSFFSTPAGSVATLSDPTVVSPTFTVDVLGDYIAELVVNNGSFDSPADSVTITAQNTVPIADAGPDQTVTVADTVTLDASGSTDPDSMPAALTYAWELTTIPPLSTATLSDLTAIGPTFDADMAGTYVAQLLVFDGADYSLADTVTITANPPFVNTPPVADAGPDQFVTTTDTVTLDGSGSSDFDTDPLTYSWSLIAIPATSTAVLSDPTAIGPTFDADLDGVYTAQLIVNDGTDDSDPITVTITASTVPPNNPPIADAGPDQNVSVAATVTLDGTGSSDPDSSPGPFTYSWSLTGMPLGSTATLSDATASGPTFVADLVGAYTVQLIVNDGADPSPLDEVIITAAAIPNTPPIANAGTDQTVGVSDTVNLNGGGSSDPDSGPGPFTYSWSLTSVPSGSSAALTGATTVNPTFGADLPGDYIAQLIVNDGADDSPADTVTITAIAGTGPGPFEQTGGVLSIEAEHFATNVAAGGRAEWTLLDPLADASNTQAIKASTGGSTTTAGAGSYTTYVAQMDAGTQNVWFRFRSFSSSTDSFFFQYDGETIQPRYLNPDDGQWHWVALNTPINVATSGVHTLTIYRREQQTEIDKLVTTTDLGFNPQTVNLGLGPVESPRVSGVNVMPVANAGPDQGVLIAATVTLDGSNSADANGDALTFSWSFTSVPGGSTATLSDPTAVGPTFIADLAGEYIAQLVVNDGALNSTADAVVITAAPPPPNVPPVADAGPDQNVGVSSTVTLDGTGSSDPDSSPGPFTYGWLLTSMPSGSTATLSDATASGPTFVADLEGAYTVQLIVNDGEDPSPLDEVIITAAVVPNTPPVADAGPDQNVGVSSTVTLDGSGSIDPDSSPGPFSYGWSLTSVPSGSTATLSDVTASGPTFVADLEGTYTVQLIVNDGADPSPLDEVTITASVSTGTGAFVQTAGIASMEAENFTTNTAAGGRAEWIVLNPQADASNTQAIKASNGGVTNNPGAGTSPTTTYEVQLDAGTQNVWFRFRSFNSSTDSFFFQFNGETITPRYLNPDDGQWHWVELSSTITVGGPGVYTLTIHRREAQTEIDKLVLTTDSGFDPDAVNAGLGPDESPRL